MGVVLHYSIFFMLYIHSLRICFGCLDDNCRVLAFPSYFLIADKCLESHTILIVQHVQDISLCKLLCYNEPNCVSVNYEIQTKKRCELNNSTHLAHDADFKEREGCLYHGATSACNNPRCHNNGTCQSGLTEKKYRCLCPSGFTGEHCENDINECKEGTHNCSSNAVCNNTKGSYNCTCKPGYEGNGNNCTASTCKDIYRRTLANENTAYLLDVGSTKVPVYCHMTTHGLDTCGGGGWTLVMKINGSKKTFHYNSSLWRDKVDFNLPGGETGLDTHETKLPTYWNTPFNKICLGMKVDQQFKSVVINYQARSLYSLIEDNIYRNTSLGRDTWKTLINGSQASLQTNCNKEGFNVLCHGSSPSKARIGIVANNEDDCESCDSRIGFGTGGYYDDSNTCGNEATHYADNGDQHIKAMGYILVQ
ncbi:uncharacterized protein [Porites lutea]|uniref:uncharacterized protein isoform X1 n=1 Tax=Porites lutea TaxID=51062 RepID=UPI003CC5B6B0